MNGALLMRCVGAYVTSVSRNPPRPRADHVFDFGRAFALATHRYAFPSKEAFFLGVPLERRTQHRAVLLEQGLARC